MQPCAVCGSPDVDAAGYCVRCRTYRGVPAGPRIAPPPRTRSPLVIPLIALSGTLVVLVVAIVVVVVVRSRASGPGAGSGQGGVAGASISPGSLVDECVVGTWSTSHYEEDVPVAGVGNVRFTGDGAEVRLRRDGTGVTDYKDGTAFTATIAATTYKLVVSGTVRFGYHTSGGTVSFSGVTASGKETLTRTDTGQQVTQDLTGSSDPASYTCSGDSLTEFTNQYRAELRRLSRTG